MGPDRVIAVGVVSGPAIAFTLEGSFSAAGSAETFSGTARAVLQGQTVVLECGPVRIERAGEIMVTPVERQGSSFVIRDVTIGVQFHWERKEDQRFPGALKLVASGETVTAINIVSVEDYLTSVISSEMSAASSMNLLQAHAITSRSWLLAQIEKSRRLKKQPMPYRTAFEDTESRVRWYDREDHALFDVCADDHCQRYQGVTRASTVGVKRAVDGTRGCVVTHNGAVCDARFSKSCGGISEPFENVWEPVRFPYLVNIVDRDLQGAFEPDDVSGESAAQAWIRSSPDAFCNTADRRILSQVLLKYDQETTDFYRWKVAYTQEELSDLICRKSGVDFGRILDLVPVERGPSGRLKLLKIVGERRSLIIGKELEIRRTLSESHLYSSAFVVDTSGGAGDAPERFVLTGAGWGHGVGLCQIGAAVMGDVGYPPEAILRHYFRGTEITQLY